MAHAFESAVITNITDSKKSMAINKGHLDGVRIGTKGRFVFNNGTMDYPQLVDVAYAEAVKVNHNNSIWIVIHIENSELLKKHQKYVFFDFENLLDGRSPYRIRDRKIIFSPNNQEEEDIPDSLSLRGDDYIESDEIIQTEAPTLEDIEAVETKKWEKGTKQFDPDLGYTSSVGLPKLDSKGIEDIQDTEKQKDFSAAVTQTIESTNALKEGLKGLHSHKKYKNIHREDYNYRKYYLRKGQLLKDTAAGKMQKGGPLWSADMDDRELRQFMAHSGLLEERSRQQFIFSHKVGHEVLLRLGVNLRRNTTATDQYYNQNGFGVDVEYEYFLSRTSEALQRWSVGLGIGSRVNYYAVGALNARARERTYGAGINYYFYNLPSTIKRYAWYIGTGLKYGSAELSTIYMENNTYKYKLSSIGEMRLGTKYRFSAGDELSNVLKMGWGLNFQLAYEPVRLTKTDSQDLGNDINGLVTVNDLKFSVGFSIVL